MKSFPIMIDTIHKAIVNPNEDFAWFGLLCAGFHGIGLLAADQFGIDIPWFIGLSWWVLTCTLFIIWGEQKMNTTGQYVYFMLACISSVIGLLIIPFILVSLPMLLFRKKYTGRRNNG